MTIKTHFPVEFQVVIVDFLEPDVNRLYNINENIIIDVSMHAGSSLRWKWNTVDFTS